MMQLTSNARNARCQVLPRFFETWIDEQRFHLHELVDISERLEQQHRNPGSNVNATWSVDDMNLGGLIERVTVKYESYIMSKSMWAKNHITSMFAPPWLSTLEVSYLWVGGWRPALAFQILYSKSYIQMEARAEEVRMRLTTGDLADLSQSQRIRLDTLEGEIASDEKEIMEALQNSIGDKSTVRLVHSMSEMMLRGEEVDQRPVGEHLSHKEARQAEVLQMADELRLRTLKEVMDILSPIQCVHFLIAMVEMQLRIHEWGLIRDAANNPARDVGVIGDGRARQL